MPEMVPVVGHAVPALQQKCPQSRAARQTRNLKTDNFTPQSTVEGV
jgi:hypothetical protein